MSFKNKIQWFITIMYIGYKKCSINSFNTPFKIKKQNLERVKNENKQKMA